MSVRRRPVGSERSAAQRCGAADAAECDPPVRDPKLRKIPRFYNVSGGFLPTPGTTAHAPGHSRALRGRRYSGGPGRRTDRRLGCRNGGGQRGKAAARKRLRAERRQERGEAAGTGQSEAGGSTMAPQRAVTGNRPQAASSNGQHRRKARRRNEQAETNEGCGSIRRMRRRVYRNLYERRRSSGPAPVPCCDMPASSGSGPNYRPASDGRPNIRRALAVVTAATSPGVVPLIAAIRSQTNRT